jgi:hypothetical protein
MIAADSFWRQTPWLLGRFFDVIVDASDYAPLKVNTEARSTMTQATVSFKITERDGVSPHPMAVFVL